MLRTVVLFFFAWEVCDLTINAPQKSYNILYEDKTNDL